MTDQSLGVTISGAAVATTCLSGTGAMTVHEQELVVDRDVGFA